MVKEQDAALKKHTRKAASIRIQEDQTRREGVKGNEAIELMNYLIK